MLITNIKRIAAILLMVCFVLPLSRCEKSGKFEATETKNATAASAASQPASDKTYEDKYAYRNLSTDAALESALTIATFFWPLVIFILVRGKTLGFRMTMTVDVLELLLCAGSAYVVYGLVLFDELRYGGFLAFLALGVYSIAALGEILLRLWPRVRPSRTAS
jgi:hypothetical protein